MAENKGIIYYKLGSEFHYEGDTVKNCGLTGGEIDGNFHFLRGYDIASFNKSDDKEEIIFKRINGDELKINVKEYFNDFNFEYDSINGILKIVMPYGKTVDLEGFITESYFKKYDDEIKKLNEIIDRFGTHIENIKTQIIDIDKNIETIESDMLLKQEQIDNLSQEIEEIEIPTIDEIKESILNDSIFVNSNEIKAVITDGKIEFKFADDAIFGVV